MNENDAGGDSRRFLAAPSLDADDIIINNIRSIEEANEGDITFIANKKYLKKLKTD